MIVSLRACRGVREPENDKSRSNTGFRTCLRWRDIDRCRVSFSSYRMCSVYAAQPSGGYKSTEIA